ncbi:5127_t:CDS:2 [Paraglomus occultum]|uniref:5127_t:CDS:1 n=1 Tax=Paraglomus occultum TaxID=144539 RepID=A0A9N9F8L8_9GLOM|nr:5127_t:CDS:2 [Paraglomus occultum]
MSSKPTVLVLGGVGFVGRHFVTYLVENQLASEIRVVDKTMPVTSYLTKRQTEVFEQVEYVQGNLSDQAHIESAFERADNSTFDYVFNCAGETRYSLNELFYEQRIFNLSTRNAQEAAKRGVKCFVELSTAEIYESDKKPSNEKGKIKPWTTIAKYKARAEEEIKKIPNLNYVILRPAIIYGTGATTGLTPRLVCGRIYKHLDEPMKDLWTKDLKISTVHVNDVVRAMWQVATRYSDPSQSNEGSRIYNLADSDLGKLSQLIGGIFGIETGFQNRTVNTLVEKDLDSAVEEINEKHIGPWGTLLEKANITISPVSPYIDKELLLHNALSIDGTLITREIGFEYTVPQLTEEKLREIIDGFKELNGWPN